MGFRVNAINMQPMKESSETVLQHKLWPPTYHDLACYFVGIICSQAESRPGCSMESVLSAPFASVCNTCLTSFVCLWGVGKGMIPSFSAQLVGGNVYAERLRTRQVLCGRPSCFLLFASEGIQ